MCKSISNNKIMFLFFSFQKFINLFSIISIFSSADLNSVIFSNFDKIKFISVLRTDVTIHEDIKHPRNAAVISLPVEAT